MQSNGTGLIIDEHDVAKMQVAVTFAHKALGTPRLECRFAGSVIGFGCQLQCRHACPVRSAGQLRTQRCEILQCCGFDRCRCAIFRTRPDRWHAGMKTGNDRRQRIDMLRRDPALHQQVIHQAGGGKTAHADGEFDDWI